MIIPIEIQLPITIVVRHERESLIISITSSPSDLTDNQPADLSQLTWTLGGIHPHRKLVLNSGQSVLLGYRVPDVRHFNLDLSPGGITVLHTDYIGSNLLDYLRSSITEFGEPIVGTHDPRGCFDDDDKDEKEKPSAKKAAALGTLAGLAVVVALAIGSKA